MTRGKHAAAAAHRRSTHQAAADLDTYQRRVAELTAENKTLRAQLKTTTAAHAQEVRILNARLSEGAAPELEALEAQLRRLMGSRDKAQSQLREFQVKHDRLWSQLIAQLIELGIVRSHAEGLNLLMTTATDDAKEGRDARVIYHSADHADGGAAEAIRQRRDGIRSGAQIVADLKRRMGAA